MTHISEYMSKDMINENKECSSMFSALLIQSRKPQLSVIVGELPSGWRDIIGKNDIKAASFKIQDAFAYAANLLMARQAYVYTEVREDYIAESIVTKALSDYGLTKEPVKFEKIGRGGFGVAYRFKVADRDYVLKVFRDSHAGEYSKLGHGQFQEINRAAFFKRNAGKSQFIPFHFGDPANSYMITDYADGVNEPSGEVIIDDFGVRSVDCNHKNLIGGYIVDYGGLKLEERDLGQNKTVRWVMKQIRNAYNPAEIWQKISCRKDISEGLQLGLIASLDNLVDDNNCGRIENLCSMDLTPLAKLALINEFEYIPPDKRLFYLEKLTERKDKATQEIFKMIESLQSIERWPAFKFSESSESEYVVLRRILLVNRKSLPEDMR